MQGIYSILAFRGPIGCQKYHIFTRVFIEIPYQEEQGILRCEQGIILLEQGFSLKQQGSRCVLGIGAALGRSARLATALPC